MADQVGKEVILKRLEALNAELEVYASDHGKVTKILKDLETKIIFTRGKVTEMAGLIQLLEEPVDGESVPSIVNMEEKSE